MLRNRSVEKKKLLYPLLAVLLAAGIYAWGLRYYGGLYRAGALLSLSAVTAQNAGRMLLQNLTVSAAEIVILLGAWLRWRGSAAQVFGVRVLSSLLFSLGGYTAGACGFYALRRWSKTLWLPVLIHAAMDFTAVFV